MLTLFCLPKPFIGNINIIQRNAIKSWALLRPHCEVILFGDEEGTADCASEFSVRHVSQVVKNQFGTPLLNAVFSDVRRIASNSLLCYVNADIILMKDLLSAAKCIRFKDFLMTGRKWNLDIQGPLYFRGGWEAALSKRIRKEGSIGSVDALDYFLFPKNGGVKDLPPFAVGRPVWDNWLIFRARQLKTPVIDATHAVMVIHQNHGYGHVPRQNGDHWEGPEAAMNRHLVGDLNRIFTLLDATYVMKNRNLTRNLSYSHIRRRWQTLGILSPHLLPYATLISRLLNFLRKLLNLASRRA